MLWCTHRNLWLTDEGAQSAQGLDLVSGMIQSKQSDSFSLSMETFCVSKFRSTRDMLTSLGLHNLMT